jgi:hypothetical protein
VTTEAGDYGVGMRRDPSLVSTLRARTRLAYSAALRDAAEYARSLVSTAADRLSHHGDHITRSRRLRVLDMRAATFAVFLELAEGASWHEVAHAAALDEDAARARWEPVWVLWCDGKEPPWHGMAGVADLVVGSKRSAQVLEDWYWETGGGHRDGADVPRRAVSEHLY